MIPVRVESVTERDGRHIVTLRRRPAGSAYVLVVEDPARYQVGAEFEIPELNTSGAAPKKPRTPKRPGKIETV